MKVFSRLGRALLALVLPPEERESVLGDLDEELWRRREAGHGPLAARIWHARECVALAAWFARERTAEALGLRRSPGSGARGDGDETGRPGTGETTMAWDGWLRDARHASRGLLRRPLVAGTVVVTVAVAIGVNAAMFGVVDAAFLRDLPYPDEDRLVRVFNTFEGSRGEFVLSPLDWRDVASRTDVVEGVGVYEPRSYHWIRDGEARRVSAARASAGLFEVLGFRPHLGRAFRPPDEEPGAGGTAVLSHGFWERAFGADSSVVGRTLDLDGDSYRVIGVAPPGFRMPRDVELWVPAALEPVWFTPDRRGWEFLYAVARLRPGIGPAEAGRAFTRTLAESAPERVSGSGQRIRAVGLRRHMRGDAGRAVLLLAGAGGFLLLIACANLANLLLARAEVREREFALRRALGSGASPILRLVTLETGLLASAGGVLGLAGAWWALGVLGPGRFEALTGMRPPSLDPGALAATAALTAGAALLFGVAPALRAIRTEPRGALRSGGRGRHGSAGASRLRSWLVAGEVALALVMAVGVALSLGNFRRLTAQDPGFRPEGVLAVSLELPPSGYGAGEAGAFYRRLLERVHGAPGVSAAGLVNRLPLSGRGWSASFELVSPSPAVEGRNLGGNMRPVSPGYFRTLGIDLVAGRVLEAADGPGARPVAVVDETVARRAWPGRSPVGEEIDLTTLSDEPATVVGVVEDVKDEGLHVAPAGHVYFPVLQRPQRRMTLVARSGTGDPVALAPALRSAVHELEPRIPVYDVRTLEGHVSDVVAGPRMALLLMTGFGAAALLLAAVGIYGVLSYTVARRTGEIGTRVALGADPTSVTWMVVGDVMRMWGAGAVVGTGASILLGGLADRLLYGVDPADPMILAGTAAATGIVALAASLVPARRAARVDCMEALRAE